MTSEAEELLKAATQLSAEERAVLVVRLLDTIAPQDAHEEHGAAQRAESTARLDAARVGDIEVVDHADALRLIAE